MRDFALLTAAIVFVMLLALAWVSWLTYVNHSEQVTEDLAQEATRIEYTLESEIEGTGHLLKAVGRQIAAGKTDDLHRITQLLQAFAGGDRQYALWSWANAADQVLITSSKGILNPPVNVADRDYVQQVHQQPWVPTIGVPTEGRVSRRWIIPQAVGVTNDTGQYVGEVQASIDIDALTRQINHLVQRDGISFAIVSRDFVPLTVVADSDQFSLSESHIRQLKNLPPGQPSQGVLSQASPLSGGNIYSYYMISPKYPYIIVVGYDNHVTSNAIRSLLWPRVVQVVVVAAFLLSLLWIIRSRVIKPVVELTTNAARISRSGGSYPMLTHAGSHEIEQLAIQLGEIGDYIAERHLVEDELRGKIVHLHRHQQRLQMDTRQRASLLAGLLSEYKKSLRGINSGAQVLKDQVFGPIEDARYRQTAADIHQTGTTLELMVRKLIALSRVDAAAIIMRDEPVSLQGVLEGARGFALDAMEGLAPLNLQIAEDVAGITLQLDSLYTRQALAYVLIYLAACQPAETLEARLLRIPASKGDEDLVLMLGSGAPDSLTTEMVCHVLDVAESESLPFPSEDNLVHDLHITLAGAMFSQQQIMLAQMSGNKVLWVLIRIPARRLMLQRQEES